jgi:hypothetical protein
LPRTETAFWQLPRGQAALTYIVYGVVYMVGAILELDASRQITHWGFVPWWAFYVMGAAFLVVLPIFIWKDVRWLLWILMVSTAGKALWLCYLQGRRWSTGNATPLYDWLFALVAMSTSLMLLRAALARRNR